MRKLAKITNYSIYWLAVLLIVSLLVAVSRISRFFQMEEEYPTLISEV